MNITKTILKTFCCPIQLVLASCTGGPKSNVHVVCNEHNDLLLVLASAGKPVNRYKDIVHALEQCKESDVLLVLADDYPRKKTRLPENFYQTVEAKKLRVYVEFPDRLRSGATGEIKSTTKQRFVVTSDFFGEELSSMNIVDAGLFSFVQVPGRDCHLKGAKVAGFKQAVYGLEDTPDFPVLFEDGNILVSTTKLSDFNKSRFSPRNSWEKALKGILDFLSVDIEQSGIKWDPIVAPTYDAEQALPDNAYQQAVERGADWYHKGQFLIHPTWQGKWLSIDTLPLPVGPPLDPGFPSGDGSLGVMEGHYSYINPDGSQQYRYWLRADCVAETAMTLAIAGKESESSPNRDVASNLMDFMYNTDAFKTLSSKDPDMSSYGLMGWAGTRKSRYYGDDNARVILGSILTSQALENNKWDKQVLELILGNFRTAGKKGFRTNALNGDYIDETSWQVLMEKDIVNMAPHYESWLWAIYLWLYDKTGYKPLLDKAKIAIETTMEGYPNQWTWTNGIQQERARMILPLAWLVRVEDTQKHREWLRMICDELLKYQVACGALREELGVGSKGKYGTPKSNDHYGKAEAPVIHTNGDPVADMLYTSNFAFFALNEAANATEEKKYVEAVNKLADFMVRIQANSSGRKDLDGCWFRAFDYENWEYYGSNADHGWGAWGTLTGWTQSFITTTLALKMQGTSFWDYTKESTIGDGIESSWAHMLPGVEHEK